MAAVLGGLVGATAVAAAGAGFPRAQRARGGTEGCPDTARRWLYAYLTLLNARDGGINGVPLVWEECETVWDVTLTSSAMNA